MIQKFDFDTNIERRMPTTGKVFYVNRMTSDYAVAHPFDVDGFLEDTYQKWAGCENIGFVETREALRNQWTKTLSVTRPSGDASIYPNNNGAHHPALMEVWMKAGDYWRRGFRLGDRLPAIVPGCKITRLGEGEWIALFPKDAHLLEESTEETREGQEPGDIEDGHRCSSPCVSQPMPRRMRRQKQDVMQLYSTPTITIDHTMEDDHSERNKKIFAAVATAVVFLVLVNYVGLFGIAALGLLAGGLVK